MKRLIFVLIVFFVLVGSFLTAFVHASQVFTIPPLSEKTSTINLNQGESVNGSFSVTGGTGTGIDFLVTDPNGKELLSSNFTSYNSFSFSASVTGAYTLSFDNSFCSCVGGKNVTLEYSVNPPASTNLEVSSSGELPVVTLLILVIAGISGATVVILLRRPKAIASRAKYTRTNDV